MSDEYTIEERLDGCRVALQKNSIFYWIGIVLFGIGNGLSDVTQSGFPVVIAWIGWGIVGLPKIIAMLKGGFGAALFSPFKADYEVVTLQNGVRISSDGGSESIFTNFVGKLFMAGLFLVIGGIFTILHLIVLTFRYWGLSRKTKIKPPFKQSGGFIILMNWAVIFAYLVITIFIAFLGGAL